MTFPLRATLTVSLALALGTALAADLPPPPAVVQKQALSAQGADLKLSLIHI